MAGFHFKETMSGTYKKEGAPHDEPERPMHFTIEVRAQSLLRHLRDKRAQLEGQLHMAGFAEHAAITGVLTINPLFGKLIRYEFDFTADDGKPYHFVGQKDVALAELVRTMTTLPGEVRDASERVVARAQLLFDKRHLPRFLGSFRPDF